MSKKITILGATGHIGTPLVHHLLAQGHQVTAVAGPSARLDALQQAGATIKAGDAHDVAFLTDAFAGADAAFLMMPPNTTAPDALAQMQLVADAILAAVRAAGLPAAVHLSSVGADLASGTGPVAGMHRQEAYLNALDGLAVTHLRPTYFMDSIMKNLLSNLPLIQQMGFIGSALRPDVPFSLVATRDIAARAAELLAGPIEDGRIEYLLGPRDYTMQEVTAVFAEALGRPGLPYVQFSYEDAKQNMIQTGLSEVIADSFNELSQFMNGEKGVLFAPRDARSTTPTTLEEFAQEVFVPAFQAATAGASATA